jgi:TcpE family
VVDLPVHTELMRLERRLYQVGEVELPRPVTLVEASVFLGGLAVLIAFGRLVGLGLDPSWAWVCVVVPWLAARACTGLVADRKRPHQWALSQLRYALMEPRLLARLRPVREPARVRIGARVWQPDRRPRRLARGPWWR